MQFTKMLEYRGWYIGIWWSSDLVTVEGFVFKNQNGTEARHRQVASTEHHQYDAEGTVIYHCKFWIDSQITFERNYLYGMVHEIEEEKGILEEPAFVRLA